MLARYGLSVVGLLLLQLIRSLALRVMCSIRVKEIVQIQLLAVKKCCMDRCVWVSHVLGRAVRLRAESHPCHAAQLAVCA